MVSEASRSTGFTSCGEPSAPGEAPFVSGEVAFVSGEAPFVLGNAAFACRLVRLTASIAALVWDIAALHSVGADFAFGFATFVSCDYVNDGGSHSDMGDDPGRMSGYLARRTPVRTAKPRRKRKNRRVDGGSRSLR